MTGQSTIFVDVSPFQKQGSKKVLFVRELRCRGGNRLTSHYLEAGWHGWILMVSCPTKKEERT